MLVTVKVYAALRQYVAETVPASGRQVVLPAGSTVGDAVARLGLPADTAVVTMVNGTVRLSEHVLSQGDTLHVFPPVVGG